MMKAMLATEEKAVVSLVKSAGSPAHVAFEEGDTSAVAARPADPCRASGRVQRMRTRCDEERERSHQRRRDVETAAG